MNWAIDVSGYDSRRYIWPSGYRYDLPIDWKKARDEGGIRLAIMKSSEGTTFTDLAFRMNWSGAKGILPRAAYHFFRSNQNAITQAWHMMDLLEQDWNPESDFVILDFETMDGMSGQQCLSAMGSFMYEIQKWGVKLPLIYTYPSFWSAIGGTTATWARAYPLGLAQWPMDNWAGVVKVPPYLFTAPMLADLKYKVQTGILRPARLAPWVSPVIWQFTARADTKAVPGHPAVKTACDYNVVYMPLPKVDGVPAPPPVPVPADNLYKVTSLSLKVFQGAGDYYKQVSMPLIYGTFVKVLQYTTAFGENWARIESPAGWVRATYLAKA